MGHFTAYTPNVSREFFAFQTKSVDAFSFPLAFYREMFLCSFCNEDLWNAINLVYSTLTNRFNIHSTVHMIYLYCISLYANSDDGARVHLAISTVICLGTRPSNRCKMQDATKRWENTLPTTKLKLHELPSQSMNYSMYILRIVQQLWGHGGAIFQKVCASHSNVNIVIALQIGVKITFCIF